MVTKTLSVKLQDGQNSKTFISEIVKPLSPTEIKTLNQKRKNIPYLIVMAYCC